MQGLCILRQSVTVTKERSSQSQPPQHINKSSESNSDKLLLGGPEYQYSNVLSKLSIQALVHSQVKPAGMCSALHA